MTNQTVATNALLTMWVDVLAEQDRFVRATAITDLNIPDGYPDDGKDYEFVPEDQANVVTSKVKGSNNLHAPVLDIDIPHRLVPSSTPGHSHLYLDVVITKEKYFRLLKVLADCGIIEDGYFNCSEARGFTSVRKEGVVKTDDERKPKDIPHE